jgi:hypothetical protein
MLELYIFSLDYWLDSPEVFKLWHDGGLNLLLTKGWGLEFGFVYAIRYFSKEFVPPALTINVPLFKKMRDIIFFLRDNNFLSHFKGHFEGSKKSRPPQNVPRNGSRLCPKFS